MTKGLLKSRTTKGILRKKALLACEPHKGEYWEIYKNYRNHYNKLIKAAKLLTLNKLIQKNAGNSKEIWRLVNNYINKRNLRSEEIQKLIIKDEEITEKREMAEKFNGYFTSIGKELTNNYNTGKYEFKKYLGEATSQKFKFKEVSQTEVLKTIKSLEPKRSSGYDGVSNLILKSIADGITIPLTIIINNSFRTKEFPSLWKIAKVVPIFKRGGKGIIGNYRPISLLPTMSKIIEKLMDAQLREYLDKENLLNEDQYGFRKGHETSHALIKTQDLILQARKNKELTIGVFLDLKKAFDTVSHKTLLEKIKHLGIDNSLLKSYLTHRRQYTDINGEKSNKRNIECGVPQGSILGPLLFLIFINDLQNSTNMKTILFADDTTLLASDRDAKKLIKETNNNLQKIKKWFEANGLTVHEQKTNFMVFNHTDGKEFDEKIIYGKTKLRKNRGNRG